jgi:hypothetical protein
MRLSPDQWVFWQFGFVRLNATILFTWGLMLLLVLGSWLITRRLSHDLKRSRWQNLLEIVVTGIEKQIEEVGLPQPGNIYLFSGHALPVRRRGQPVHRHSRLRAPDRLAVDHGGARAVRVGGRAAVRHRTRAWAATSSPTSSRRSSCCRSISSAKSRARWRWPSACSAT